MNVCTHVCMCIYIYILHTHRHIHRHPPAYICWPARLTHVTTSLRIIRETDSIHHHHPEGVVYRSFCLYSGIAAVSKNTSRRWWCIESLFPNISSSSKPKTFIDFKLLSTELSERSSMSHPWTSNNFICHRSVGCLSTYPMQKHT